ncbi:hypothetical protein BVX98_01370 [bacterium F11]|nr:hypothetical protein BVX98_01370 [bacterium F11]
MDNSHQNKSVQLSVIIPVHNEKACVKPLFYEIKNVLDPLSLSYEVIFSNDGSHDGTGAILEELYHQFSHSIRVVTLRSRSGKAIAISSGLSIARGRIILTMDGDGQDVPSEIPRFLSKCEEGFDMVNGWRQKRLDPFLKRFSSKVFNLVTRILSGISLKDFNCGFKLYRREALESVAFYGGLYRYLTLLVHQHGFRITEIPVAHRPRLHGSSKYGPSRLLSGFLDFVTVIFITRFLIHPLHLFGTLGFSMAGAGLLIDTYLSVLWFQGQSIGQRPLLALGNLLILIGIQVILMGLIGEMIARFLHQKEKSFPIKGILGPPSESHSQEEKRPQFSPH